MPRGFMDDLEGKVVGKKVHEGGFGTIYFPLICTSDVICSSSVGSYKANIIASIILIEGSIIEAAYNERERIL